jgi:FtsH-binding integral membrane protein
VICEKWFESRSFGPTQKKFCRNRWDNYSALEILRKDFSFLRGILTIAGFVALGLIVCGAVFGFGLGLLFSVVMVGVASAAILYDTSKIIHHYSTDRYVAASLELFASVALMFWYVLRIMMSLSRR